MSNLKTIELITNAEKLALNAQNLASFSKINLNSIKNEVASVLELIGRNSIFEEYTLHDISHINSMLSLLEWIIPDETKLIMTSSEWMMLVLAVYFHDLGMIVTKSEYENRNNSSFPSFKFNLLKENTDLDEKIKAFETEEQAEKFLYQEFVRHKHPERIKLWIMGDNNNSLGCSNQAISVIKNILAPLDMVIKKDLAMICESHHLNDLDNFQKYKTRQSYGNDQQEIMNLQYISILLRTADLLHITKDRTPSVQYLLIDPKDPISQEEWAKQLAVRSVLPQPGVDKNNLPDDNAIKDTIEVYATFTEGNENGFFGLTSYLNYVQQQLRQSNEWATKAKKIHGSKHNFWWRHIDQKNIETVGFLQEKFEFTLDQTKILDLLIGHTIYNDTNVVVRELIQNAIDAVRLQTIISKEKNTPFNGQIFIEWNDETRILSVRDNGTGMSQEIIEKHLLKAGSSRYQDNQFKEDYPNFSAISRFGIGILSTFMVADTVEIITNSIEDPEARHLTLKSVHGSYLVKLLNKNTTNVTNEISPHGTIIKLKLRPSAKLNDLINTINKWILIPPCELQVKINDNSPIILGFSNPKDAIESYLSKQPINSRKYRVDQFTHNGVTLAYALLWSEYTSTWNFMNVHYTNTEELIPVGTCVEGIRVEFSAPGFKRNSIVAIANVTGPNSPKTNVARSDIENSNEKESMLRTIYQIYIQHIKNEMFELHSKRKYSLTWAIKESEYLVNSLFSYLNPSDYITMDVLRSEINELKLLLIEKKNTGRENISINEMITISEFWTIDSQAISSAENIIKEIPDGSSLYKLFQNEENELFKLPDGIIIPGNPYISKWKKFAFEYKEIKGINIIRDQRRIDYLWGNTHPDSVWVYLPERLKDLDLFKYENHRRTRINDAFNVYVATDSVKISGVNDEIAVISYGKVFLLPDNPLSNFCLSYLRRLNNENTSLEDQVAASILMLLTYQLFNKQERNQNKDLENLIDLIVQETNIKQFYPGIKINENIDIIEFEKLVISNNLSVFSPSAWSLRRTIFSEEIFGF